MTLNGFDFISYHVCRVKPVKRSEALWPLFKLNTVFAFSIPSIVQIKSQISALFIFYPLFSQVTCSTFNFHRGIILTIFHWGTIERLCYNGIQQWPGTQNLWPGIWHNFLPGISPLGLFFTGMKASGALSRDVTSNRNILFDILNFYQRLNSSYHVKNIRDWYSYIPYRYIALYSRPKTPEKAAKIIIHLSWILYISFYENSVIMKFEGISFCSLFRRHVALGRKDERR